MRMIFSCNEHYVNVDFIKKFTIRQGYFDTIRSLLNLINADGHYCNHARKFFSAKNRLLQKNYKKYYVCHYLKKYCMCQSIYIILLLK